MATQPTQDAVPSESPRDLKFNAGKIDEFVTSMGWNYTDRFDVKHYTIEGINYLSQQAMAAYGYVILTGKTFTTGATINNPNEVLLNTADGEYYKWTGSFASGAKVVPANSTPSGTGGIGPGAWLGVGDSSLRSALASVNGSNLVGYKNPQSQLVETVKLALDKINVRLIYASDFGVKTDGSDNADALWNLGQFISNATVPLYVIFPKGVSLVGSQEFAGATGKGYSYRPSYFSRAWGDASDMGWFSVHRTDNDITLDMTGWTLKINNGMKHGSFDPVTGAVYNPASLPFYNYDYQAGHGYIFKFYKTPNLKLIGATINGNITGAVWGGNFGDDGYQVPSYNVWVNQSSGIYINRVKSDSSPVDAIYFGETPSFTSSILSTNKRTLVEDCIFSNSGRNIITYAGGFGATFNRCDAYNAGDNAAGISGHGSGPASCLDVEAEGGQIGFLTFNQCRFFNGGDVAVVAGYPMPSDVTNVTFNECIIHCLTGEYAFINYARNCKLNSCKVYGGINLDTSTKRESTYLINSNFYNRLNGVYFDNFKIHGISDFVQGCIFNYEIQPGSTKDIQVFLLTPSVTANGGYGSKLVFENNQLFINGVSNDLVHVDLGSIAYYSDVELHVEGSVTGTKNIKLDMSSCASSLGGMSTNISLFNFGTTMIKQDGINMWYANGNGMLTASDFVPKTDGGTTIGRRGKEYNLIYSKSGVFTRSPNGTPYKLSVNDAGSITITPQ